MCKITGVNKGLIKNEPEAMYSGLVFFMGKTDGIYNLSRFIAVCGNWFFFVIFPLYEN